MRRLLISTLALGGLVMSGAAAHAAGPSDRPARDKSFSVELFAGGHYFGRDTNLGVAAAPDATAGGRSNAVTGLRVGVGLWSWSSLEVEVLGMLTSDRTYHRRAGLLGYRLSLLAFLLPGNLRPYLLVGAGALEVVTTQADGAAGMVRDRDGEFHVGGGVDYRLRDHVAVRLDARAVQMPGKQSASLSADIEATVAVVFPFGAGPRAAAAPPVAEPPPSSPATAGAPPAAKATVEPTAPPASGPAPAAVAPPAGGEPATEKTESSAAAAPESSAPAASVATVPATPRAPTVAPSSTPAAPTASASPSRTPLPPIKELLTRAKEIRFDGSSSKLSLVSLPFIGQLAEALMRDSSLELEIVAHVAGTGNAAKDMGTSKRRAEAVRRALVEREVASDRLVITGRGSEAPLAPNITRTGRKLNERIELKLLVPDKVTR